MYQAAPATITNSAATAARSGGNIERFPFFVAPLSGFFGAGDPSE
jgi:hypothetical protein